MRDLSINHAQQNFNVSPTVGASTSASTAAEDSTALAEFSHRMEMDHHAKNTHHHHKNIRQRQFNRANRRPGSSGTSGSQGVNSQHEDDALHGATEEAIDGLNQNGQAFLERQLTREYDPLGRNTLMRNMRSHIKKSKKFSDSEKDKMLEQVDSMHSNLMAQHGDVIRPAMKEAQEFEASIDAMDALAAKNNKDYNPQAAPKLREAYSKSSKQRAPITAYGYTKSCHDDFGAENCDVGMQREHKEMAASLHGMPNPAINDRAKPGPRMWLSLSDMAEIKVAQTSLAIAGDLRRELGKPPINTVPKGAQSTTSLALLGVAQPGGHNAELLTGQILHADTMSDQQKKAASAVIAKHLDRLPTKLWDPSKLSQRMDFMDELRGRNSGAQAPIELEHAPDKVIERDLRGKIRAKL